MGKAHPLSNNLSLMTTLTRERAEEITKRFQGKRIIVLGDLMLDEFIWGRVRRISPEAPVPVVEVDRHTRALGGAGNVAANLVSLGATAIPVGIVGDDSNADKLRGAFAAIGIDSSSLAMDDSRPTTLKTRIVAHNQQVVRADHESRAPVSSEVEARVLKFFLRELASADAVAVSDYGKGLLTASLLRSTLTAARTRGIPVCLDPKSRDFTHYQPVTVITPNTHEAVEAAGVNVDGASAVVDAGAKILESVDCGAVLITRGEEGMTLFKRDGSVTHVPTSAREVYDVTGAGDTVIATLTAGLASGAEIAESAVLANHAASVVVSKLGTATLTAEELLASI
ncbi:MAG: D-glycero-beta-D-manno-heptose-7-phosphate kinase [Blastocatellia bacterium AA13]|nr:MAG: D-glycero-beta-D-manno-heptose-7-phosphate kinase [Blastocatellia bacterium AA13]